MDDTGLSYKTLHNILTREQRSSFLSKIDEHFYEAAATYLETLTEDPNTSSNPLKKKLLEQEHKRVRSIIDDIYHQREKKILLAALHSARGGTPDIKNILPQEQILYDNTLENLTTTRSTLLPPQDKTQPPKTSSKQQKQQHTRPPTPQQKASSTKNLQKQTAPPPKTPPQPPHKTITQDHTLVLVQSNTPSFVGPDMKTYTLHQHDIITIPRSLLPLLTKEHLVKEILLTKHHTSTTQGTST